MVFILVMSVLIATGASHHRFGEPERGADILKAIQASYIIVGSGAGRQMKMSEKKLTSEERERTEMIAVWTVWSEHTFGGSVVGVFLTSREAEQAVARQVHGSYLKCDLEVELRDGRVTAAKAREFIAEMDRMVASVEAGKNPGFDASGELGMKVILYAERLGLSDTVAVLMNTGVDKNDSLMRAQSLGRYDLVRKFLDLGADLNARDSDGNTLLMENAHFDNGIETLEFLIENGAEVNARRKDGKTALMIAAQYNAMGIEALIGAGAKVNVKDNLDRSPLMDGVTGDMKCMEALIAGGADVNFK